MNDVTERVARSGTLAWSSLVAGLLSLLPAPGPLAGLLAIVLGLLCPTGPDGRRPGPARAGILIGTAGFLLFATFCIVYFGILGYPLPRIERYHPEPG